MPQVGPFYPGTVMTEAVAPENAADWTNPSNISADDDTLAEITGGALDQPEVSHRLKASNFGVTLPAGATVDGIVVEIQRQTPAASEAKDYRVQLLDETGALVGDNKADTVTTWPTSLTTVSYGGASDKWGWATVDEAKLEDPDFGVVLAVEADDANANPQVDFIRIAAIHYTEGGGGDATVTPGVITAGASVLQVGVAAGSVATPAVIASAASLPAVGPSAGSTATPAAISSPVSVPQASVLTDGNATVSPAVIAALASLPGAVPSASSIRTPAAISIVAALPGASLSAGVVVTPGVLAAAVSLPQAGPIAGAVVSPAVLAAIASLPQVSLFTGVTVIRVEGSPSYLIGIQGAGRSRSGIEIA